MILGLIKALLVPTFLVIALASCGSSGAGDASPQPLTTTTSSGQGFKPTILSTDLAVGLNRFVFALFGPEEQMVMDAQVSFSLYFLGGEEGHQETYLREVDAQPINLDKSYTHVHEDGTRETHTSGKIGVYVAELEFDVSGEWGVIMKGTWAGQSFDAVPWAFDVATEPRSLISEVGLPAPRSVQPILKDVEDIQELGTGQAPISDMHSITISDAVSSGAPTLIVFATPGFCSSQICGPTKEIVDRLHEVYKGRAHFIHIEPYYLEEARSGEDLIPVIAMGEWGLSTEPWVFLVNNKGIITAKYEAFVTYSELENSLTPLLSP